MKFTLEEMNGLLNGKCLPSDLIVGETLAEYLARKFSALEWSLVESERYGRQTDITIDNLEMKLAQMAVENAGLKAGALDEIEVINRGGQAYCVKDGMSVSPLYARGWNDYRAKSLSVETPSTDAFLAEVRASGVDAAIERLINKFEGTGRIGVPVMALEWLAKELRKGVQS